MLMLWTSDHTSIRVSDGVDPSSAPIRKSGLPVSCDGSGHQPVFSSSGFTSHMNLKLEAAPFSSSNVKKTFI